MWASKPKLGLNLRARSNNSQRAGLAALGLKRSWQPPLETQPVYSVRHKSLQLIARRPEDSTLRPLTLSSPWRDDTELDTSGREVTPTHLLRVGISCGCTLTLALLCQSHPDPWHCSTNPDASPLLGLLVSGGAEPIKSGWQILLLGTKKWS